MNQNDLLLCLVHVIGRASMREQDIREIVGSGKQLKAFNLCDGSFSQAEIARKAKINEGNFSRTAARWVQNGVLFRIGEGEEVRLLHIYPIPAVGGRRNKEGKSR